MTVDRRYRRYADVVFGAAVVGAFAVHLWLAGDLAFDREGGTVVGSSDDWSIDALMAPVDASWALGLRLIWNSLMATIGSSSYLPYVAIASILHVAIATGIYGYARRLTHPLIATTVGVLFLFLGTAIEGSLLAAQPGWMGAAAAGTWALVVLLREPEAGPAWLLGTLLVVAVLIFSGVGLAFVAAAGAVVVVSPARRRMWPALVPAAGAVAIWYLTYGRDVLPSLPDPPTLLDQVMNGVAHSIGQVSGVGTQIGFVLAVLLGIAVLANLVSHDRLRLGLIAGCVGLLAGWTLIGLARSDDVAGLVILPRDLHIGAIFVLIAVAGLFAGRHLGNEGDRWPARFAVLAVFGLAMAWNIAELLPSAGVL